MNFLPHRFPVVPVTFKVWEIFLGDPKRGTPTRIEFGALRKSDERWLHFAQGRGSPIRVILDENTLRKKFFYGLVSDSVVKMLIRKYYEAEIEKRRFTLVPYFSEQNLETCFLKVKAHHALAGLGVDSRQKGVINWVNLYPLKSCERKQAHELLNVVAREQKKIRRMRHARQQRGYSYL